jgi:hypothetical protein
MDVTRDRVIGTLRPSTFRLSHSHSNAFIRADSRIRSGIRARRVRTREALVLSAQRKTLRLNVLR